MKGGWRGDPPGDWSRSRLAERQKGLGKLSSGIPSSALLPGGQPRLRRWRDPGALMARPLSSPVRSQDLCGSVLGLNVP